MREVWMKRRKRDRGREERRGEKEQGGSVRVKATDKEAILF